MRLAIITFITFFLIHPAHSRSLEMKKTVGRYEIQAKLDRNPPIIGDNQIEIEIKDTEGKRVTNANVLVNYYMPPMPRMAPMNYQTDAKLKRGRYKATMNFSMAGPWIIAIKITLEGKTSTVKFNVDSQ